MTSALTRKHFISPSWINYRPINRILDYFRYILDLACETSEELQSGKSGFKGNLILKKETIQVREHLTVKQ